MNESMPQGANVDYGMYRRIHENKSLNELREELQILIAKERKLLESDVFSDTVIDATDEEAFVNSVSQHGEVGDIQTKRGIIEDIIDALAQEKKAA